MLTAGRARLVLALTGALALAACEESTGFNLFAGDGQKPGTESAPAASTSTTIVERDVEAPEVFQKTEAGLWDGRPSLGGVWVAHPDVGDPERVIIRNTENGKFVIGALFRRERDNPGPRFQVSSDAAAALGMLAGAPAELNVTALRREEVPVEPDATAPAVDTLEDDSAIEEKTIDPVAEAAASAIEKATAETPPPARPEPAKPKSALAKPFIQIGIFSIEANAERTAGMMRKAGMIPLIKAAELNGRKYWRVLVGPATSAAERKALLEKVRGLGFADAYAVTN